MTAMRTPGSYRGNVNNVNDIIRSTIINRINNENYNSYFPVTVIDDEASSSKRKKAIIILPNRYDEL